MQGVSPEEQTKECCRLQSVEEDFPHPATPKLMEDQILNVQKEKELGENIVLGVMAYLFEIMDFLLMLLARLVCVDESANQPTIDQSHSNSFVMQTRNCPLYVLELNITR